MKMVTVLISATIPEGVELQKGKRGGVYYETDKGTKVYVPEKSKDKTSRNRMNVIREMDEIHRTIEDLGLKSSFKSIAKGLIKAPTKGIPAEYAASGKIDNITTINELKGEHKVSKKEVAAIGNIKGLEGASPEVKQNLALIKKYMEALDAEGDGPDRVLRFEKNVKNVLSGKQDPSLFVKQPNGKLYCVAGNTRSMISQALGKPTKAKIVSA